jgi:muramoyltetrapeptide carboxypeptidase
MIYAPKLQSGDTIGIICLSHIYEPERYAVVIGNIRRMGFHVKLGANVAKDTDGYLASAEERAEDLNGMVADSDVKMILFGGGNGAAEILPYIDYANVAEHPKLFSSYSDGTSILNAIHAQTGLITYYGAGTGIFGDLTPFDRQQFESAFVFGNGSTEYNHGGNWTIINDRFDGQCEGILLGGYLSLFLHMLANRYFKYDKTQRYILFVETHEMFSSPDEAAGHYAFLEQSAFMDNVDGLLVGTYAATPPESYLRRLKRLGEKKNIPVVYSDSFGHGAQHGILPIGEQARLTRTAVVFGKK